MVDTLFIASCKKPDRATKMAAFCQNATGAVAKVHLVAGSYNVTAYPANLEQWDKVYVYAMGCQDQRIFATA